MYEAGAGQLERVERWHEFLDVVAAAANHQCVPHGGSPHAARDAAFDVGDSLLVKHASASLVVGPATVADVHDKVVRVEHPGQRLDQSVGPLGVWTVDRRDVTRAELGARTPSHRPPPAGLSSGGTGLPLSRWARSRSASQFGHR